MTVMQDTAGTTSERRRCGCCGRPRTRLTELGDTPGVFICAGCALWAARRAGGLPRISLRAALPAVLALGRRLRNPGGSVVRAAIAILPSADFDRTVSFYSALGFDPAGRHESYLLLHDGPVELQFNLVTQAAPSVQCFLHVPDALAIWKRLRELDTPGVGPVADQDYGLREFTLTDPDGNHLRIRSPLH